MEKHETVCVCVDTVFVPDRYPTADSQTISEGPQVESVHEAALHLSEQLDKTAGDGNASQSRSGNHIDTLEQDEGSVGPVAATDIRRLSRKRARSSVGEMGLGES